MTGAPPLAVRMQRIVNATAKGKEAADAAAAGGVTVGALRAWRARGERLIGRSTVPAGDDLLYLRFAEAMKLAGRPGPSGLPMKPVVISAAAGARPGPDASRDAFLIGAAYPRHYRRASSEGLPEAVATTLKELRGVIPLGNGAGHHYAAWWRAVDAFDGYLLALEEAGWPTSDVAAAVGLTRKGVRRRIVAARRRGCVASHPEGSEVPSRAMGRGSGVEIVPAPVDTPAPRASRVPPAIARNVTVLAANELAYRRGTRERQEAARRLARAVDSAVSQGIPLRNLAAASGVSKDRLRRAAG